MLSVYTLERSKRMNSSAAYIVPDSKMREFYLKIPERMRRQIPALKWAIKNAIAVVESEGETVGWLVTRWNTYLKSEEGSGPYHRSAANWLKDEAWGEPDEAWGARKKQAPTPVDTERVLDEQIQTEAIKKEGVWEDRRAMMEKVSVYSDEEVARAMKEIRSKKPYLPDGDPKKSWILAVAVIEYLGEKDAVANTEDTESPA
jgi:hypothetical protein